MYKEELMAVKSWQFMTSVNQLRIHLPASDLHANKVRLVP